MSFERLARRFSHYAGSPYAMGAALLLVFVWFLVSAFLFRFNALSQLFINTTTTVITFLMVFLIQNAQNTDTKAIHAKLDEIIFAIEDASNALIEIEKRPQDLDATQHNQEKRLQQ